MNSSSKRLLYNEKVKQRPSVKAKVNRVFKETYTQKKPKFISLREPQSIKINNFHTRYSRNIDFHKKNKPTRVQKDRSLSPNLKYWITPRSSYKRKRAHRTPDFTQSKLRKSNWVIVSRSPLPRKFNLSTIGS